MRLFGDYDGSVALWNNGKVVPSSIQEYLDFVVPRLPDSGSPVVDVGCGKAILTATFAETVAGREVFGVDRHNKAIAVGRYTFISLDVSSAELTNFLTERNIDTVISRRSLCLFLSDEWLDCLVGVKHLFSEALNNEDHRFANAYAEATFLSERGWTVEVDGRFIHASRS